jgi:type I restriction enzyme, S subunit
MSSLWSELTIGEFSKISSGGTPSTSKTEYWKNGDIPWLSSGEVHKKRIRYSDGYITKLGLENSSAKLLPKKTILVALAGQGKTRGTIAITEFEATTNQSIAGIFPETLVCFPDFLFHNLDSRYLELRSESGGSGRAGLNLSILSEISIKLPPLPEQQKIASILTSVDDVIEKTQAQIDKLQDLKKGTMNELLTRGIGHTEFKGSPIGRIPKKWENKPASNIFEFINGKAFYSDGYSEEGYVVVDLLNININCKFQLTIKDKYISHELYQKYPRSHLRQNDLIIIMTDITPTLGLIGKTAIIDRNNTYVLNQRVGCLRPLDERTISIQFMSYMFNSDFVRNQVIKNTLGTAQFYINTPQIKNLNIPIPPLPEQQKIASILSSIDTNIEEKQNKLNHIKSLKKSLMQDLLTGKVRVSVN